MQVLINDLLAFSRVTTKAQPFEQIDLAEIVTDVISDLEERITSSDGRVEVGDLPPPSRRIRYRCDSLSRISSAML